MARADTQVPSHDSGTVTVGFDGQKSLPHSLVSVERLLNICL